jgi:hypothetical protein
VLNNCCWLVMSSSVAFNWAAVSCSSCSDGKSFALGACNSWVRTGASCALPNCSPTALSCISMRRVYPTHSSAQIH